MDQALAAIRDEWLAVGMSTEPADRSRAESGVWDAYRAVGHQAPALMFIWVESPMAGVLASTYVGFALGEPMRDRLVTPLDAVLGPNVPVAQRIRTEVDVSVWDVGRAAVSHQLVAELAARGPAWERSKSKIGSYAWDQVWQTVGDQVYSQAWEGQARESESLFEANLPSWPAGLIDGQFGAGAMAELDTVQVLDDVDPAPFVGLQRVARSCGWWWGFEAGAVLCERPARFEISDGRASIEFRDGWTVGT